MKRTQYSPEFKAQAVIEVICEEGTVNKIAAKYSVNPVKLCRWKAEFLERADVDEIETPRELRSITKSYMFLYNHQRPHSSINDLTPAKMFNLNLASQVS